MASLNNMLTTKIKNNEHKENLTRLIAFYLPQFHFIPENDEWWGKGFTEWTNTAKAQPMFHGHYQPHVPADLGFYDLRLPEARTAQAELAREYGIEGFCYWHYWFGNGKRLLERPFNEVLKSGKPDFPFCIAWANQTWTGVWHGAPKRVLIEQTYPGERDYEAHFNALREAFHDHRYIKVDGKPVFIVYDIQNLPESKRFSDCWRKLAVQSGLKGLYLIAQAAPHWIPTEHGFDASVIDLLPVIFKKLRLSKLTFFDKCYRYVTKNDLRLVFQKLFNQPEVYSYREAIDHADIALSDDFVQFPTVLPNWDNTPRSGHRGIVLHQSTPNLFQEHLERTIGRVINRDYDKRIVFIKSWNEWAEGNYLEPDLKFGRAYLDVIKRVNRAEVF